MLSNSPTSVVLGGARGMKVLQRHALGERGEMSSGVIQPTDVGGFGGSEGNSK